MARGDMAPRGRTVAPQKVARVTTTGTLAVADTPSAPVALTTIVYAPSGAAAGSKTNDCGPAPTKPSKSVITVVPVASTSVAVTLAGALVEYEIVLVSSTPSPFGVTTSGVARSPVTFSGGGLAPI